MQLLWQRCNKLLIATSPILCLRKTPMKALLFTEFPEMVAEDFGYSTANAILLNAGLFSEGTYTSARTHHRNEMSILFWQQQKHTKPPFEVLAKSFGLHLCRQMLIAHAQQLGYPSRVLVLMARKDLFPFEFLHCDGKTMAMIHHPEQRTECITDGIIRGRLEHLRYLNRVEETPWQNGQRKFV
jgi:hypothetical protein